MASSLANRHPTELMAFAGRRFVCASEVEQGAQFAEARIKNLTGSDPITARAMRQDFTTFLPTFKLWIAGNFLPSFQSVGEAMQRRIHLIPFAITIPPEERDKRLLEKLREESEGILMWCIAGALAYLREGLAVPDKVVAAGRDYMSESDTVSAWLEDRTTQHEAGFTGFAIAFEDYKRHTESLGDRPLGLSQASSVIRAAGL
jgi:putative DNA primase/helicase